MGRSGEIQFVLCICLNRFRLQSCDAVLQLGTAGVHTSLKDSRGLTTHLEAGLKAQTGA